MNPAPLFLGTSGLLLFAIGLVLGFAIPLLRNSRMGLSAHLTAVQTGPALVAIGLFWRYCSVPPAWDWPLAVVLAGSSYILVCGIGLAAATGASEALPIAGKGHRGTRMQERLVSVLVVGSSLAMLGAIIPVCWFALGAVIVP
ncbi:hypothetical protein [Qipengyuania sp. JC766]|uniref:hypothetical protein n=1 Tax=Qipengyuania sp. JC766 TaxID=3232139 RepID=UPI00345A34D3